MFLLNEHMFLPGAAGILRHIVWPLLKACPKVRMSAAYAMREIEKIGNNMSRD